MRSTVNSRKVLECEVSREKEGKSTLEVKFKKMFCIYGKY